MTWYKDQKVLELSSKHDKAIDEKNIKTLQSLVEKSTSLASEEELHPMIRAKHYYNSATSLYELQGIKNLKQLELENNIEKILYLYRQSINLQENYIEELEKMETEEQGNFFAVYNSTIVNYSNLLSSLGRIPSAIASIRKSAVTGFGMAIGNMGGYLKHYSQVDYDTGHRGNHYIESLKLLKIAVESEDPNIHPFAREVFNKDIVTTLSFFKNMTYEDIEVDTTLLFTKINEVDWYDSTINEEDRYSNWKVVNSLALNTLNDYDKREERENDSLHLPNMVMSVNETKPIYHGLFNQIKQEYCAARYLLFDGIYNKSLHFSDDDVYLIDTLDYPVYSLNIEKIKSAYRTIYSLFDRIAFLLNEYLDLGIKRNRISFNLMWSKRKDILKKDYKTNKIFSIIDKNYLVRGLYWIKKDLYNNTESGYNGVVNPHLNRAYKIRNTMEHKYLKIIDNNFIDAYKVEDSLAEMIVSQQEFEKLAVDLLKTVREAIIILTQIIYLEEYKNSQSDIPGISLIEFSDEWKL